MKCKFTLVVSIFIVVCHLANAEIVIESPMGGFTTNRIQKIKGYVRNTFGNLKLVVNGVPQHLVTSNGQFEVDIVSAPGSNLVEIQAGSEKKSVSYFAKVPPKDIKVVMMWDTATDVDLWVIDPSGEKCYYSNKKTKAGGNLDVDVTSGFGPETFTMAKAMPGTYNVQANYYASNGAPITRVDVYVVQYEGLPNEKMEHFQFVMTKASQVYQIARFQIDPTQ